METRGITGEMEKKKKTPTAKRPKAPAAERAEEPRSYPDADPEWEHLEERYSQIGSEMRSLAKMLGVNGDTEPAPPDER